MRGANLDGSHGGLQQVRIRFEMRNGNASKNDARYQAAAHAAARRWLPHPNFLHSATRHPVKGELNKMVEHGTVIKLGELGARSHEAGGDVSRIAAASAANHSLGDRNARLGRKGPRWRVQREHRREGRAGLRLPKQRLAQALLGEVAGERNKHAGVDGARVQLCKGDRAPVRVKRPTLERHDFADKVVGVCVSGCGMRHLQR